MDINQLTIGEAKEIAAIVNGAGGGVTRCDNSPWIVGKKYLIRTVTMIFTGCLTQVTAKELVITDAAWIAETERWADTVRGGGFKEVEPYPDGADVIIGRGSVIDAVVVDWKLPRKQK